MTPESRKRRTIIRSIALRKKAVELHEEEGWGCKRIAKEVGVDVSTIRQWLKRYEAYGVGALVPYWRPKAAVTDRYHLREKEQQYADALEVYATSLESVRSITRRYGLKYQPFKNFVETYHPELVNRRNNLRKPVVGQDR